MAHKKGSPGYPTTYLNVRKSIQKLSTHFPTYKNPFQTLSINIVNLFYFEEDTPKITTLNLEEEIKFILNYLYTI